MPEHTKLQASESDITTHFFSPLGYASKGINNERKRSIIKNLDWVSGGITRTLQSVKSGRDFLQTIVPVQLAEDWKRSSYFDALKSVKRLTELRQLADALSQQIMPAIMPDRLKSLPELDQFDVYAGDGHWHEHATHDPKKPRHRTAQGRTESAMSYYASGHLYGLNLRTRGLTHLIHCDEQTKLKEHDMGALKRLDAESLRQGTQRGRKTLWIWDSAGIDYQQWYQWKQSCGVYFLSLAKDNMNLKATCDPVDHSNPVNAGIAQDGLLLEGPQTSVRLVVYNDPVSGETFRLITNVITKSVEPGTIAQLYRMRWDIEKSFDALKNQLQETKAWATSSTAKTMQATFLTLALNLVTMFEHYVEKVRKVRNTPERNRKAKRIRNERKQLKEKAFKAPALYWRLQRFTKTSVKFIRWLRIHLWTSTPWPDALGRLKGVYASL